MEIGGWVKRRACEWGGRHGVELKGIVTCCLAAAFCGGVGGTEEGGVLPDSTPALEREFFIDNLLV